MRVRCDTVHGMMMMMILITMPRFRYEIYGMRVFTLNMFLSTMPWVTCDTIYHDNEELYHMRITSDAIRCLMIMKIMMYSDDAIQMRVRCDSMHYSNGVFQMFVVVILVFQQLLRRFDFAKPAMKFRKLWIWHLCEVFQTLLFCFWFVIHRIMKSLTLLWCCIWREWLWWFSEYL